MHKDKRVIEGKKVAFLTLGCKVNSYETEGMRELFLKAGAEETAFETNADVYVVNTCSVTNMADRKSRQMLHRAKKKNPEALIVAAGCYAQAAGEKLTEQEEIDLVVGNNQKAKIVELVEAVLEQREEHRCAVLDIGKEKAYEELPIETVTERTRAYIKIEDGCNQFCSYCIIPYARGRIRSRNPQEVVEEVKRLAASGYQEIVLTGIHLSSYGQPAAEDEQPLLALIRQLNVVEGIKRIRLGSLEPRIITEEFAKTIAGLEKMCPHFHLSLQSGCNATLRRMNRRYSAEEYYEKCQLLRKYFKNPALTTDVIVGFPGETDEEFAESKAFVDKIDFYETHIFKYSKREGTKAAVMPNQVPEQVKTTRSNELLKLDEEKRKKYEANLIGTEVEVLMEEAMQMNGKTVQVGHTKEYVKVVYETEEDLQNQLVNVQIDNQFQIIR